MSEVKWIKICTDIFDDEKILLLESMPESDSIIVIWFKLLCLAGKQNNSGVFIMNDRIAYTDEMLATIFRRNVNTVRMALSAFESFGMIESIDGVITIPNWGKHQSLDKIESRNEYMRNYMKGYREKQKIKALPESKSCKVNSKVNSKVNVSEADIDIEIDKDIDIESSDKKRKRFSPPTFDEVSSYCKERNNSIDAQRFIDFYESKGWYVGKNKMKDWKACIRTWEKRDSSKSQYKPNDNNEWEDFE